MTEIKTLRLINLAKDGKITEETLNMAIVYLDENHKKSAQIGQWKKEAEFRKKALIKMGFENVYGRQHFVKIVYNEDKTQIESDTLLEVFFTDDFIDEISAKIGGVDMSWNDRTKKIELFTMVDILGNPDKFPDLIKYFEIRDDLPAIKKFLEQTEKE